MIEIRNPTQNEVNVIVDILLDAFADKFSYIFNNELEKGREIIEKYYQTIHKDELDNHFVAVEDNTILGAIQLKYKGAKSSTGNVSLTDIISKLGIFRGLSATVALSVLDYEDFNKDSCYVSFVGVLPESRGKGIGTKLLEKAEEFARSNNLPLLSLSVIGTNTGAIKLYKNLDFKKIKHNNTVLGSLLFGVTEYYYMEKTL